MLFTLQADDTYLQLKKDLEYLDLKVRYGDGQTLSRFLLVILVYLLF